MSIVKSTVKKFQTSDGKIFPTAPMAAIHQASVDFTQGLKEVESDQWKTSDGRTWDEEGGATQHQAMLDFEPVFKEYIKENPQIFSVQAAETRFRTLTAPFAGWLAARGVDLKPAVPGNEEEEAEEEAEEAV